MSSRTRSQREWVAAFTRTTSLCLSLALAAVQASADDGSTGDASGKDTQIEGTLIPFDISAQPLAGALRTLAEQARLQIMFTPSAVTERSAPAIRGSLSSQEALQRLLEGTTLEYVRRGNVLIVRERATTKASTRTGEGQGSASAAPEPAGRLHGAGEEAAALPVSAADTPRRNAAGAQAALGEATTELGETLVTGSLIRGARAASPLTTLERDDIDATGYTTLQQVVQTLPQNFGGGDNEGTVASPGGSGINNSKGAAINLRGLGSDSTLVLLNGRRLAPSAFGQFVDISMIPLTAIERIDVLADGASATYGSDAVAGVVNFVLNEDFSGLTTEVKGGTVTEGHLDEYQAALTAGASRDRYHGMITYEYFKRGNLDSNEREFSRSALDPFDLLAEQERHSILASGAFALTDGMELGATGAYSERDSYFRAANTVSLQPTLQPGRTSFTSASSSLTYEWGAAWSSELTALFGRTDTSRDVIFPAMTLAAERNRLEVKSLDVRADGPLLALPAGPLRIAVGASVREETYSALVTANRNPNGERRATAVFAEFNVPVHTSLTATLATRYEDYDDFGDTLDPKFGLVWWPNDIVRVRSTWGTSFRAPQLNEINEYNVSSVLRNLVDPAAPDGRTLTMLLTGNNGGLQPEQATTWTAGLDLYGLFESDTTLSLTYFDIRFDDRIQQPVPNLELLTIFNRADLYASIITRNPDDAFIAALAARPGFQNTFGPFVPGDVEAFLDRRLQNFSNTRASGFDLSAAYQVRLGDHELALSLAGTYLLEHAEALTPDAPELEQVDTIYHPLQLRLRSGLRWTRGPWQSALFVNYAGGYRNTTVTPEQPIDDWTTLDLNLRYESSWLAGTRISLSVQNLLDEEPPFVASPLAAFAFGFDATNASGLGRFVSLGLAKQW